MLRIEPATSYDYGEYVFEGINSFGRSESKCLVNIERKGGYGGGGGYPPKSAPPLIPPIFEEIMEDATISIGGNASFNVQVKGSNPIQVTWKLNNKTITNSDKSRGEIFFVYFFFKTVKNKNRGLYGGLFGEKLGEKVANLTESSVKGFQQRKINLKLINF